MASRPSLGSENKSALVINHRPVFLQRNPHFMPVSPPINLYDLTREELRVLFVRWGFSAVHVARLWNYLYLELAASFEAMPELPAKVRTRLAAETVIGILP